MQPTQNTVTQPVTAPPEAGTLAAETGTLAAYFYAKAMHRRPGDPVVPAPSEAVIARLTPASVLRAAAGYLHQFGWWQGDLFDDPEQPTPCACPLGAIRMAVIGTPEICAEQLRSDVLAAFDAAVAVFADYLISECDQPAPAAPWGVLFPADLEQVVGRWNDHPNRNVGQVLAALYGAADEWDRTNAKRGSCGCPPYECSERCCVSGTCTCTPDLGGDR